MQKKIIALAIAAAFAAPVAMAEVTVFGTVDGGFRHQSQDKSATHAESVNGMTSGQYNSNRWGIKASDDLGDGMKANVVLEGGFSIADGTAGVAATTTATGTGTPEAATYKTTAGQLFDRQATVGLSGNWGRVDFGRQNAINFKTAVALNPFGSNYINYAYVGVASNGVVRLDRLSSYTGTFGDLTVMVELAADNSVAGGPSAANIATATATTTEPTTGASRAVGASYKLADLVIAGSYTSAEATPDGTDEKNTKNTILGANYKIGDAKVFVATAKTTTAGATGVSDAESKVSWIGATYAMSDKVGLTAALYKSTYTATGSTVESDSQRVMVGATYAMGKMTKLYAGVDTQTNNAGGTAPDLKTQGVSVGVSTGF